MGASGAHATLREPAGVGDGHAAPRDFFHRHRHRHRCGRTGLCTGRRGAGHRRVDGSAVPAPARGAGSAAGAGLRRVRTDLRPVGPHPRERGDPGGGRHTPSAHGLAGQPGGNRPPLPPPRDRPAVRLHARGGPDRGRQHRVGRHCAVVARVASAAAQRRRTGDDHQLLSAYGRNSAAGRRQRPPTAAHRPTPLAPGAPTPRIRPGSGQGRPVLHRTPAHGLLCPRPGRPSHLHQPCRRRAAGCRRCLTAGQPPVGGAGVVAGSRVRRAVPRCRGHAPADLLHRATPTGHVAVLPALPE